MRHQLRITKALIGLGGAAILVGASSGIAAAAPPAKVTICHGTASATNPYVVITVSEKSFKDGHFDDQTAPSHGQKNSPDLVAQGDSCVETVEY